MDLFDAITHNARDLERIAPLARELAMDRIASGKEGITVADLRQAAVNRGLLTGEETGRRLSYLGAAMRAAGLKPTEEYRRSTIAKSHGNLHRVWVL